MTRLGNHAYVTARMGMSNRKKVCTGVVPASEHNANGENVTWTAADRNFLKVDRAIHDHGILVLEVLDHEDADNTDCYVGGCAINVQPYLRVMGRDNETSGSEMDSAISTAVSGLGHLAKNSAAAELAISRNASVDIDSTNELDLELNLSADKDGWVTDNFPLFDDGTPNGADAGILHARLRWVEDATHYEDGYLIIHVVRGVGLRDVLTAPIVQEMRNFSDSGPLMMYLALLLIYIIIGVLFCMLGLGWGVLDSLIFVTTTFTTVGYGNHPDNFALEGFVVTKALISLYIIIGMSLLGAIAGVVGSTVTQAMKSVEKHCEVVEVAMPELLRSSGMMPERVVPDEEHDMADAAQVVVEDRSVAREIAFPLTALIVTILTGAVVYGITEDLQYLDAVYFTVVTTSTTGYGDYTPSSFASKVFTVFYLPVAVCMLAYSCHTIARIPMTLRRGALEQHVLDQFNRGLNEHDFSELKRTVHKSKGDAISRNDFSLAMLMRLGYITSQDVQRVEALFSTLDKDGSGNLDPGDISCLCREGQQRHIELELALEAEEERQHAANLIAVNNPMGQDDSNSELNQGLSQDSE